jgi:prepilin-type N-terminal cleavage/methylation domain-containing protein
MTNTTKKGFTLIELLIVIAIIAILAVAVVLILNPAQLLAQARDSQRISDLDTLRTAIALYLSTVTNFSLTTGNGNCYVYTGAPASCGSRHTALTMVASGLRTVGNGTGGNLGWLPVDFAAIPGGSPLSVLPIDPRNGATYFYSYVGNTAGAFELNADMESSRYAACGSDDAETTDGGNKGLTSDCPGGASIATAVREVGNATGLAL